MNLPRQHNLVVRNSQIKKKILIFFVHHSEGFSLLLQKIVTFQGVCKSYKNKFRQIQLKICCFDNIYLLILSAILTQNIFECVSKRRIYLILVKEISKPMYAITYSYTG